MPQKQIVGTGFEKWFAKVCIEPPNGFLCEELARVAGFLFSDSLTAAGALGIKADTQYTRH